MFLRGYTFYSAVVTSVHSFDYTHGGYKQGCYIIRIITFIVHFRKIVLQFLFLHEGNAKCDVTCLTGSGEWLATPLRARRQAGTWTSGGGVWLKPPRAESSRRRKYNLPLAQFGQSIPHKMAYHSPYRAAPHMNAPPDQGFLWNIFQRWVLRKAVCFAARLPLTLLRSENCCRV